MDEIRELQIFGAVVAFVWVVEFQKRGLPHMHPLLFLDPADKPRTIEDYDGMVCAELPPDEQEHLSLRDKVLRFMVHGPCDERSPCWRNGCCRHSFPFIHEETTRVNEHGKVFFKRRRGLSATTRSGQVVDSRWIAPYNPYLLHRFNCHINLDIITSVRSVKYLFKYLHKGPDMATIEIGHWDEVAHFVTGRYVSATDAMWRIMSYPVTCNYPAVIRLHIHLPGQHVDDGDQLEATTSNSRNQRTTLTKWFDYNRQFSEARSVLYPDFPITHVWKKQDKKWQIRQQGKPAIGRIPFIDPRNSELFHLRLLLYNVSGATSFDDLKSYRGRRYASFQEATVARGLSDGGQEWHICLAESRSFASPRQMRKLFALILATATPTEHRLLWDAYSGDMCEDFAHRGGTPNPIFAALMDIHNNLLCFGTSLSNFEHLQSLLDEHHQLLLSDNHQQNDDIEWIRHQSVISEEALNDEQRVLFTQIIAEATSSNSGKHQHFINATGGCGKTFLYNAIIFKLLSMGRQVVATASTGIASTLLHDGTTAHRRFGIVGDGRAVSEAGHGLDESSKTLIQSADVIIWDEASMITSRQLSYVEQTLRTVMGNQRAKLTGRAFGGKLMLFGGDWHQTLPVIKRGTASDVIAATIKRSVFWSHIIQMQLTRNMRVRSTDDDLQNQWRHFLTSVAQGAGAQADVQQITFPPHFNLEVYNFEDLMNFAYPNLHQHDTISGNVLLASTNAKVNEINCDILARFPGPEYSLKSIDTFIDDGRTEPVPQDVLNHCQPSGLPPHELKLKANVPVMLLRNLAPRVGLCNGTLLRVLEVRSRVLRVMIVSGTFSVGVHDLPRIALLSSEDDYAYVFKRLQFPVRLAFSMTINKAQGQTFDKLGLVLETPVFTHGHLYVALSRVRSYTNIKILLPRNSNRTTDNVIFRAILHGD